MSEKNLEYPLDNQFIANWLVAQPLQTDLPENMDPVAIKNQGAFPVEPLTQKSISFDQTPTESAKTVVGETELTWNYYRCLNDHLVSISAQCPRWQILSAWAYSQLVLPNQITGTLNLFSDGAVEVWLNGKLIHTSTSLPGEMRLKSIHVTFEKSNQLYVRCSSLAYGDGFCRFALQVSDWSSDEPGDTIKVTLPTIARFPHRFQIFERLFENAYLEDVVHYRGDQFFMRWMEDTRDSNYFTWEIQDKKGAYYVQGNAQPDAANPRDVGHGYRLFERPYWLALRPTGREFFDQKIRYTKRLPIHILDNKYSAAIYGSPFERRQEVLVDAAKHENSLFAMLARMELDRWQEIIPETVTKALEAVTFQEKGSENLLLGLLVMMYRFSTHPEFPKEWLGKLEAAILACDFHKTIDEWQAIGVQRESSQLVLLASQLLAGQKYPTSTFTKNGLTGDQLLAGSVISLQDWLLRRAQYGFEDWNSNSDLGFLFLGLAQLATLSENEHISELATVLLDKLIFLLAINSFKGAYGAAHGRTDAAMLKSAQLEASSGIARLLWGMGVYNHHVEGSIGLALSDYEFPTFFKEIAAGNPAELISKECQISSSGVQANTITYKTPDFMLSSVQDFRPGTPGSHEHVWQATFGPEAVVFVNHPACSSEEPAFQPGFWLGNRVLPRTVQWNDVLISIHHLPEDDWMGYTHAYFPLPAFDDFFFTDRWAYLRKGAGYLAIAASCGTQFIRQGNSAYRELRSYGDKNIWVCQLGREALDGSFDQFRSKVNALPLEFNNLSLKFTSLRTDSLSFGWDEPLLVNGSEQPLHGTSHIENPFCRVEIPAKKMDIQYEDILMRLTTE